MPKVMFDFGGQPARYGGTGGSDWVPPGRYTLRVEEFAEATSKSSGRPMFRVTYSIASGDQIGKRIVEHFVKDSEVAMGRIKGLLSCLAGKEIPNRVELDTDKLLGKHFIADVVDDHQEATEQYNARTVSKIGAFVPQFKDQAAGANGASPAQETATEEAAPEPAAVAAPATETPPAEAEAQAGAEAADDLFA